MLKRILFTVMLISMLIFGSPTAWASSPAGNWNESEETEQSQSIDTVSEQHQSVSTDGTAEEITQDQDLTTTVEQSTQANDGTGEAEKGQAVSADSDEAEEETQVSEISNESEEAEMVQDVTEAEQGEAAVATDTESDEQAENEENAPSDTVQTIEEDASVESETVVEETVSVESETVVEETVSVELETAVEENAPTEAKTSVEEKGDPYSQEQSVEIIAEQTQTVKEAEHVDAGQEQDIILELNQKLKVTKEDHQSQYQKIITEQEQSISTRDAADSVEQTLTTEINAKQTGEIDLNEDRNSSIQETTVTMKEKHEAETSGNAVIKQEQSVEAEAVSKDTTSEGFSIKAAAENSVKIIKDVAKDAASAVVNVVQSIFVNDEEVAKFEQEFNLAEGAGKNSQKYSQTFEWGTLFVLNKVFVNLTDDGDVYSKLKSIIRLDFILPKEKTVKAASDSDDSCINDSDCDGLTDDEEIALGTNPYNPDTDGDGLTDYQEVRIYFTNPLNPDTDGDGRTDYQEIYVYFSNPLVRDAVGRH